REEPPGLRVGPRRKGRDTSLDEFPATVRILVEGPDYEQALAVLADRRRSRVGPPQDSLDRWRGPARAGELAPPAPGRAGPLRNPFPTASVFGPNVPSTARS